MPSIRDARRRSLSLIAPIVAACLVSYFAYYTIDGARGLKAMTKLQGDIAVSETRLDVLQTQSAAIEKQVAHLRSNNLDTDLLDERARAVLNFTRPNDLIIRQTAK
jgi:cell division protein FtsB